MQVLVFRNKYVILFWTGKIYFFLFKLSIYIYARYRYGKRSSKEPEFFNRKIFRWGMSHQNTVKIQNLNWIVKLGGFSLDKKSLYHPEAPTGEVL